MDELLEVLPKTPGWSIIAVLVMLIFSPIAIFSRESAEKLWVIGRLVTWFRTRQERSIDRERALEEVTVRHLKGRIESLDSQLEEVRADFDAEREDARERESRIRAECEEAKGYIVYSTSWAHRVILMHAEHGWKPPIPRWFPFDEWLSDYRDRRDGR